SRPEVGDLDRSEIQKAFERATGRRQKEQTILSFLDIEERHVRYVPAVALVFRGATDEDVQIAFAVDGHISAEHEEAFAKLEGAARSGLLKELNEGGREVPTLPVDVGPPDSLPAHVQDEQERLAADAILSRAEEQQAAESLRESTTEH